MSWHVKAGGWIHVPAQYKECLWSGCIEKPWPEQPVRRKKEREITCPASSLLIFLLSKFSTWELTTLYFWISWPSFVPQRHLKLGHITSNLFSHYNLWPRLLFLLPLWVLTICSSWCCWTICQKCKWHTISPPLKTKHYLIWPLPTPPISSHDTLPPDFFQSHAP